MTDDEALERYIEVAKRMSEKGTYSWWESLEKLLIELKELRNEKVR